MRKVTLSLIFALALSGISAQENNVKDQILSYKDSEYDFVNKGRRLLIDHLQSFKMQDAIDVKNSLLNEFDGNVTEVFYNIEYIHLLYWTGEFEELLNYLKQADFDQPVSNNVRISSQTDNFSKAVYTHTAENKDILGIDVKNGELNDMERDFLLLLLNDITNPLPQNSHANPEHITKINEQANQFLANYPDSPYEKIVREQIRFVFKETDWGTYMDFGFGAVLNQGDISHQFRDGPAIHMIFEYRHRKVMGMFGFDVGSQTLKQDFPINNTVWKKGSSSTLGSIYLNAGYLVFENRRWSIYPYVGGGYTEFSAAEKEIQEDENLKKLRLNSFSTQAGIGIDLKINSISPITSYSWMYRNTDSRISLKYTYRMPHLKRKDPSLYGSQHVITLSYGIGGRGKERDL